MALVKCRECEQPVSDRARVCPSCGFDSPAYPDESQWREPPPRSSFGFTGALCIISGLSMALYCISNFRVTVEGSSIINLELLQMRQNLIIISTGLALLGAILLVARKPDVKK